MTQFVHLGEAISADARMSIEIDRRISAAPCATSVTSKFEVEGTPVATRGPHAELSLKVRLLKVEVVEALLYGCATWTLRSEDLDSLRTAHHRLYLRRLVPQKRSKWLQDCFLQSGARDDQLRTCRDVYPQTSTLVRGSPCPAERHTPSQECHERSILHTRTQSGRPPPQAMGGYPKGEPTCARGCP
ncbi:unnamed protein product, partial [Sphacelaria rigidula]